MIEDVIIFLGEIYQYRYLISIFLLGAYIIYDRYFKQGTFKLHPMLCDCDPDDVFDRMRTYRQNKPNPCSAGENCISNALYDLVESINKASVSIDLVMPEFTIPQLLECVLSSDQVVDIQILLNYSEGLENSLDVKRLMNKGNWLVPFL